MSTAETRLIEQVVDTARYPLRAPGSPAWMEAVARTREDLDSQGCSVLRAFIRPSLHDRLRREGEQIAPRAHYDTEIVNAYNIAPDTPLPDDHPGRVRLERGNAFVARDAIPAELIIHRLYTSRLFQTFLAGCSGLATIHPLADPLAGLCLNVVPPGRAHPWHFDTNDLAISLLTRSPDRGGVFEYCPGIRAPGAENTAAVRSVLDGSGEALIRRLTLRPGDLQLFNGRFSLHRVNTVQGDRARHSAVFAYSEHPGVVGTATRTKQLFGRTAPEHRAATTRPSRGDLLLD